MNTYTQRESHIRDLIPHIDLKFEPHDLWVGVYWKVTRSVESSYRCLKVYVCIVPTLPLILTWEWGWR